MVSFLFVFFISVFLAFPFIWLVFMSSFHCFVKPFKNAETLGVPSFEVEKVSLSRMFLKMLRLWVDCSSFLKIKEHFPNL